MPATPPLRVPDAFALSYGANGPQARAWLTGLPRLGEEFLDRWDLRPDGLPTHGMASLVLPVLRADGTPAVLKFQQPREETAGVAAGLRAWNGDGAVRLLDHDEDSGTQLLERLDASRTLASLTDSRAALQTLAELMARLTAVPAPQGLRQLADIAAAMLDEVPRAVRALHDSTEQHLLHSWASAVAELAGEAGDRLLHWDLHDGNVLAGERRPWLAIDPEPLAGDPAFELWPALDARLDEAIASADPERAVLRGFDHLTAVLALDRRRAAGWTLGRILQNTLWEIQDGATALDPAQLVIARAVQRRAR
ncbi:aminoglycoside phosphotransferase family protein [Streptomyces sp. NPDC049555]|uniref:aminoglycoside phosphotransferase family protein n=1 Tax=Streptomyces sp. NPDC049555 TaxID=3154930 RepID=UPI0034473EA3